MRCARAVVLTALNALSLCACATPAPEPVASDGRPASVEVTADHSGRPILKATVNGEGPYRFVVDTAATTSGVSEPLVDQLGLERTAPVKLHDLTGVQESQCVLLERLEAGELKMSDVDALVISSRALQGADAVLGLEALDTSWVSFRFPDRLGLENTDTPLSVETAARAHARITNGGIVLMRGWVGDVPTHILIDTGGTQSVANRALYNALSPRDRERWIYDEARITSASGDVIAADLAAVSILRFGELYVQNAQVAFGDFHVFDALDLTGEPTLILGMDVLKYTRELAIDYERSQVLVRR